ncbi:hypothetical protein BDQ17DRAFT_209087 [Cyathus striatus]|nr:hypothetical protein BDQ17DRAFT_209087 [Cyathus striatus]
MLDQSAITLQLSIVERNQSCCAALALLIWDFIINIEDEWRCIWSTSPVFMNPVKFGYLYVRYFTIVCHSINVYFAINSLSAVPIKPSLCILWFSIVLWCSYSLVVVFNILMMLRVYALYGKDKKVAASLFILLIIDGAISISYALRSIPALNLDATCRAHRGFKHILQFTLVVIMTQSTLLYLTIRKRKIVPDCSHPLIALVVRDSAWIWILFCGIFLANLPYSKMAAVIRIDISFMWPTAIMSIAVCKIVINMQKLKVETPVDESVYLTSHISLPDESTRISQREIFA